MGNTTSFGQIQKKYGQDGIEYVAFRHHERKTYHRIKDVINTLKDHANYHKQEALQSINQQKRLLQQQFNRAKRQAEAYDPHSIKRAQAQSKQSVEDFSGLNLELKRLQDLHQQVNIKYQSEKSALEKRIRHQIMKEQNKSHLKGIKQFDDKSDSQRRNIENQCISKYPQKASEYQIDNFEEKYTWQNQRKVFDSIFDQQKQQKDCKITRYKVRENVIPPKKPVCC